MRRSVLAPFNGIRSLPRGPALVALLALIAVLGTIDPAGNYPQSLPGPGVALDEPFNVRQGVYLVEALRVYGWGILHEDSLREVLDSPPYLPDHPPLGRVWIGAFHHLARAAVSPQQPAPATVIAAGRTASATAFALLVFLLGAATSKWHGPAAGIVAAVSLILMPRLFGHAHLAALEIFIALTYAAAVLGVCAFWRPPALPSWRAVFGTGILFGLALLTKIQAILLPVPIGLWALWHWRGRAVGPLAVWAATGLAVFVLGWPWLWLDPWTHLVEYFGRTTERAELYAWYLGERYADRAVPWHYPFVLFLTTVPVGLHVLGFWGIVGGRSQSRPGSGDQLLLACLLFPLIVFAFPGVPVYDGTRLFLVSFPLWAIFIGRGASAALDWLRQTVSSRRAAGILVAFILLQGYGLLAVGPCWLNSYNLAVGGLRGADRLGFETNYWGDGLLRSFWGDVAEAVPEGATVHVSPVVHRWQLAAWQAQSPMLQRRQVDLQPFRGFDLDRPEFLIVWYRKADLPPSVRQPPSGGRVLTEVRRQGVRLAVLYELTVDP